MIFKKAMDRNKVEDEVKKMIKGIMKSYEKEEIGEQPDVFFEQLDSLRLIELIVLTEKKFKIELPTEQLGALSDQKLDTYIGLVEQAVREAGR